MWCDSFKDRERTLKMREGGGGGQMFVIIEAIAHSHLGARSPRISQLRALLRHSEGQIWTDLDNLRVIVL